MDPDRLFLDLVLDMVFILSAFRLLSAWTSSLVLFLLSSGGEQQVKWNLLCA